MEKPDKQEIITWLCAFATDKSRALFHVPNMVFAYLRSANLLNIHNELTPEAWGLVDG